MKGIVVWAGLVAAAVLAPARAGNAEAPRTIEIAAKRFEFVPAEVHLKVGETVVLRITSQDTTHGFLSRKLGFDEEIPPGAPVAITLTPKTPGFYPVICDYFCGKGHGNMHLAIVVEP